MGGLFWRSSFNGDISKWKVSNVTNMSYMFSSSKFNGDISKWDVSKVTNMMHMFQSSHLCSDLSNWNINSHCDIDFIFFESDNSFLKEGIFFWYFALQNKIQEIDDIKAAHMGTFKPILDGMGLDGIRAARYLHQTFTNTHQNQDIINFPV